ncbi:DUF1819 family protein [Arthrobacter sp. ZGTC131]|uniref:DUF1819 family protein n=1 Tax=Arthrobacter sp. ZGTC131 TaxID=2058898 RepID=UPI0015E3FF8F|nr:DUF1819 family protein [Arthrobacter sp. ZGTC131]
MRETERYKLSFTTGGLLANECRVIAAEYLRLRDWKKARAAVRADNLIQKRTASAVLRISREAMDRASMLSDSELEIVVSGNAAERHQLVWLAICLQYRFVAEFAEEVVRERYLTMNSQLGPEDLDIFFVKKSFWHGELEELKPSTKNKLRQNLFRMLREAQIVSEAGLILPQVIGGRVVTALRQRGQGSFLVYPIRDFEIEGLMHA